jgi:hypothetical protein
MGSACRMAGKSVIGASVKNADSMISIKADELGAGLTCFTFYLYATHTDWSDSDQPKAPASASWLHPGVTALSHSKDTFIRQRANSALISSK